MQDGLCYIYYNSNTLYGFPDLNCTEGQLLPSFSSTTRQTYYLYDGKAVYSATATITNNYNNYSSYVAHIANGDRLQFVPLGYTLVCATLLALGFFSIIKSWFQRLR